MFLLLFCSFISKAADTVFTSKGGKIKDNGAGASFPIKVGKLGHSATSNKYGVEYVNVKIKSRSNDKLSVYLLGSDGMTSVALSSNNGQAGKNYDSTFFADTSLVSIGDGVVPFSGTYMPEQSLKPLNSGLSLQGMWTLVIYDSYGSKSTDTLVEWSIKFSSHPSYGLLLDSSNLPILIINTKGKTIPGSGPKLPCNTYLIDQGPGKWNHYSDSAKFRGYAGLELHGSSSRYFPKVSYSFETQDSNGTPHDTSIIGMPVDHEWVLISNWIDHTLLRNTLTQHIFSMMGHYAPRNKTIEVVLNGVYQGTYMCIERINKGSHRVNIARLDPLTTSGDSLTGGYIIKSDWSGNGGWYSQYTSRIFSYIQYFQYVHPWPENKAQKDYIHQYFDSFETALYNGKATAYPGNWRYYADGKSIMDYMLIQEMTKNVDGYQASFFMYKDRNSRDRHIHIGPTWDYDIGWGNRSYAGGVDVFSWEYSNTASSFWWFKLLGTDIYGKGDSLWKNDLKCNWTIYRRTFLSSRSIDHYLDSNATVLHYARERNFFQWPELSKTTYQKEMDTLKGWVKGRLLWLDKNIPGTCRTDIDAPVASLKWKDTVFLEVNTHYIDSGIIYNDNFGNSNVTVIASNNIDSSHLGTYLEVYRLTDKAGNATVLRRFIKVIDTIPPKISLLYGDTVKTEVLTPFKDTSVIIKDNYDPLPIIKKGGTFNFANNTPDSLGYYTLWYIVRDHSGNTDSSRLVINVVDSKAPQLTLLGRDSVFLSTNDSLPYHDSGYVVIDNFDKHPKVDTSGNFVNTQTAGIFQIIYQAQDHSSNKSASENRIITVSRPSGIEKTDGGGQLISIYPNPGTGLFLLRIKLEPGTHGNLYIYDEMGRELKSQRKEVKGEYNEILQLTDETPGIYVLKLQTDRMKSTARLVILK